MSSTPTTQPTTIEITAEEAARLSDVASRLKRLLDAWEKFVAPSVDSPLPNSEIAQAYQANLRDPYQEAYLLLFAAQDHLRTILMVLKTGPLPGFSLYTLLRAAGEAEVRGCYLLDRQVTETQRLARALNERLHNLEESRKVDPDPQSGQYYDGRIAHLEQRAIANGITSLRKNPRAPLSAFGEPRKKLTELFGLFLTAGSTAYRYLSGYTHSMMWVVLERQREAQPHADPGVSYLPTDLQVPIFASVLSTVLDLFDDNCRYWLGLAGYPGDVWENAKKGPAG